MLMVQCWVSLVAFCLLPVCYSSDCKEENKHSVPDLSTSSLRKTAVNQDYGLHVAPDLQNLLKRSSVTKQSKRKKCYHNAVNSGRKKDNSKRKKDKIDDTVAKQKVKITNLQKSIHKNLLRLFHRLKNAEKKPTRKSVFANHSIYEPLVAIGDNIVKNEVKSQDSAKTLDDPAFESTEPSGILDNNQTTNSEITDDSGDSNVQVAKIKTQLQGNNVSGPVLDSTAHVQNTSSSVSSNANIKETANTTANEQTEKTILKPLSNLNTSTLKALHRLVHKFFPNAIVQKPKEKQDNNSTNQTMPELADKLAAMGGSNSPASKSKGGGDAKIQTQGVEKKPIFKDPYAEIAAGPDHPKAPPGIKISSDTQPMLNFGMPSDITAPQGDITAPHGNNPKEKEVKTTDGGGATHGGLVNPDVPEHLPEVDKEGGGDNAGLLKPDFPFPDGPGHERPNAVNQDSAEQNMLDNMRAKAMQEQMQERLRAQAMQGVGVGFGGGMQTGMEGMAGMPGMGGRFSPPGGYAGFGGEIGPAGEEFGDGGFGRDSVFGGIPGEDFPNRPPFDDGEGLQPFEPESFNENGYGPVGAMDVPAVGRNEVPREPRQIYRKAFDDERPFDSYDTNPDEEEVEEDDFDDREPAHRSGRASYELDDRQQIAYGREGGDQFAFDDEFNNENEMDDSYDAEYERKTKIARVGNVEKKNDKNKIKLDQGLKVSKLHRRHKKT